jgi:hypothetical protein
MNAHDLPTQLAWDMGRVLHQGDRLQLLVERL